MTDYDYNPIWDGAPAPSSAGAHGRTQHVQTITPFGVRKVRVDPDGKVLEQRWKRLRALLRPNSGVRRMSVDTRERELRFPFVYRLDDGAVGYEIAVRMLVRIVDHKAVVRIGVRSVGARIVPPLKQHIDQVLTTVHLPGAADSVRALAQNCTHLQRRLAETLAPGHPFPVPEWLEAVIIAVDVDVDEASSLHRSRLIDLSHRTEQQLTEIQHKQTLASADIALRTTWSRYLEPRLGQPLARAIERVAVDPSIHNVQHIASELERREDETRRQVLDLLENLIERNFVADVEELQAIKAVVERLHGWEGVPDVSAETSGANGATVEAEVLPEPRHG